MDWFPLWNSLRIAAISCVLVFFLGIFAAYYAARLPRAVRYMRGKATATAAKTADHQTMTSRTPKASSAQAPMIRRGPSTLSRR